MDSSVTSEQLSIGTTSSSHSATSSEISCPQLTMRSAGGVSVGTEESVVVNVAVCDAEVLPQPSLAVNTYVYVVVVTVPLHVSAILSRAKSTVGDGSQSSVAMAVAAHAAGSNADSQAAVDGPAGSVSVGASVSIVMRFAISVTLLPQRSVAVKIYSVISVPPQVPVVPLATNVMVGASQLSVAVPPPKVLVQVAIAAVLFTPHCTMRSDGALVITGSVISSSVMVLVSVTSLSQASIPVKVTVIGTAHVVGKAV